MTLKSDKYGRKYRLVANKKRKYVVNGILYVSRDKTLSRNKCVSNKVFKLPLNCNVVSLQ